MSSGAALAVEDLDRTLKLVTFGMEHLRLWKDIIKQKVGQTVTQFNVQNTYGAEVSPFFSMGGVPQATDADYNREVYIVKYMGTQGQVEHNLTLIQAAHGPVVAREVKNKTIELLARNERAMFEADSDINALEYDGIDKIIREKQDEAQYKSTAFAGYDESGVDDSVVIDNAGELLDEDTCEDATLRAINNFGMPMDMYLATDIHSGFSKAFYAKQVTKPGDRTAAGYLVPEFVGSLNFKFKPSLFNRPRKVPLAASISASAAPTSGAITSPADAASKFTADDVGDYSYVISAVYADGETVATAATAGHTVAAGDKVAIVINYAGAPIYFNIFRAPKGSVVGHLFTKRIKPVGTGVAHDVDLNAKVPGSGAAHLLMHDPDVLCWKQLGSLIKYDLAVTSTSYRWLQLLYGMIVIQAPRKNVIIDNVATPARG
ncbi:MAG: hypothetical protein DRN81_02410 [Thermoproteota archaeon]|nr:MAG: hypothetical protein DRN81_02410 [Candidatus Korarchaeota archaeon]